MSKFSDALHRIQETSRPEPAPPAPQPEPSSSEPSGRRHPREEWMAEGVVFISLRDDTWIRRGIIHNLSEGGMLFEFHKPVQAGMPAFRDSEVTVRFTTETGKPDYELKGKIARCRFGKTTFIGITFHKPFTGMPDLKSRKSA